MSTSSPKTNIRRTTPLTKKHSRRVNYPLTTVLIVISIMLSILVLIAITRSSQTSCQRFNMSQRQRGQAIHMRYKPLSCSLTSFGN